MTKEAKITKIVVQMGDKEVPMSVEESKKLYFLLHELFGEKEKIVYRDTWYPRWPYHQPYYYCSTGGSLSETTNGGTILCNVNATPTLANQGGN